MTAAIPVLLYHSVSDADPGDSFSVSPARFAEHVEAIVASGRVAMTVGELARGLRDSVSLPERPVLVTFDDGYEDSLAAIEALQARAIKSTLYVSTGAIDRGRGLPLADLLALARWPADVELGAHTINHPYLDELELGEARREIEGSRQALEDAIGREILTFAYPHGAHSASLRQMVIDAGYTSAAAVKNALSHPADDPWAIARWTVRRTTTDAELAAVLAGDAPLAWQGERRRTRAYRAVRRVRRRAAPPPVSAEPATAFVNLEAPVAIRDVDVSAPLGDIAIGRAVSGAPYRAVAVLVRHGHQPLGWVAVPDAPEVLTGEALSTRIAATFESPSGHEVPPSQDAATGRAPATISIVVTTCAEPDSVLGCLRMIAANANGPYEVIVVENRPVGSPVRAAVSATFPDARDISVIDEHVQGLSSARNAGLRAARGEIVAFIDDDIVVDDVWMAAVRETFAAHPAAACVTGLILPRELETPAQLELERFAGFGKGFVQRSFSLAQPPPGSPLFPFTAGHFGSGANSAFRRDSLLALGGFDAALGTGTPARGGEDLDIYIRVIQAGHTIVYEPRAITWHRHPDTGNELERRAFSYGFGLGALIGKLVTGPSRPAILRRAVPAVIYLFDPRSRKNEGRGSEFPKQLKRLELFGLISGPFGYLRSRRQVRARERSIPSRPIA